ncbi:heparinase II/III domain-containing protein [Portibacter marinus]|uniref:heparinase II/III domain-containing protein n=1 Tax=Portibacter marinus TaxID=2898660 RepID=UPI001F1AFCC5|nr:heparinase II/III family protein [Portibacter marinus]
MNKKNFNDLVSTVSLIILISLNLIGQNPIQVDWKVNKTLEHPYLFFSENDIPVLRQRIASSSEASKIMQKLQVECNRLLYTPVGHPPPQSKNPRYDGDGQYNSWIRLLRDGMVELAFMYQMTKEQWYADKAFEFAEALCDEPKWLIKAHEFPIIYDRIWPWNALNDDDQVVFNYDIRTGDIASEMAMAYDWLYSALSKRQRDQMRGAMLEKAILLARNNYDYHWWSTSYKCNWNTICWSGMGLASMALLTENPELIDVVIETYKRNTLFLNELGNDGGWQEGRGYWAYGMRAAIYYIEAMDRLSDGVYSLYEHPKLKSYPVDFALYGLTGYFGDGKGDVVGSTHLINKLIEKTNDPDAAWYRSELMGKGKDLFDIIWPVPPVDPIEPSVASRHFSSIDWAFMRTDFLDKDHFTVACKAGYNDDPHHGHLDIGQFSIYWKGQYFITDHGRGKYVYDEKYFNNARWDYPIANSAGHNVVYVNGEQQISAKYKDEPWKEGVGGKILNFRTAPDLDYTLMDPSKAYPGNELKSWKRHLVLVKPNVLVLLDEVHSDANAEIEARFHPGVNLEVHQNFSTLKDDHGNLMAILPFNGQPKMESGSHAYLPVKKDAELIWIPYMSSILKATKTSTIMGHVIVPVDDIEHASQILKDISFSDCQTKKSKRLSFKYQNQDIELTFEEGENGLVLKK